MTNKKEIVVKSSVTVKKTSDVRQVTRKAVAGLSEAELIERHSIGTYEQRKDTEDTEDTEDTTED